MKKDKDKPLEATHYLSNIDVFEVTLTGYPAVPRASFRISKSDGAIEKTEQVVIFKKDIEKQKRSDIAKNFQIAKVDAVKKNIFGFCLLSDEGDLQGDIVSQEETTKACHSFFRNISYGQQVGTGVGKEHKEFANIGHPIESAIDYNGSIGKSLSIEKTSGAWWLGVHVTNDEVWKQIEEGEIKGFSIGGYADRKPIEQKSLFGRIASDVKSMLGIGKSDARSYDDITDDLKLRDKIWDAIYTLGDSLFSIADDEKLTDKQDMVKESIQQFYADIMALFARARTINDNENLVLSEKVESINSQLAEMIKLTDKYTETEKVEGGEMTPEEIKKTVADAVGDTVPDIVEKAVKKQFEEMDIEKTVTDKIDEILTFEVKGEDDKVEKMSLSDVIDNLSDGIVKVGEVTSKLTKAVVGSRQTTEKAVTPKDGDDDSGDDPDAKGKAKKSALDGTLFDCRVALDKMGESTAQ